ncbi:DUF6962 family protein [Bacteroidota bacterium]
MLQMFIFDRRIKPETIKIPVEKIEFTLFGMHLLEPNAFITDSLLGILALILAFKLYRLPSENTFYRYWKLFMLMFGLSTILGGTGHLLYNYTGLPGKIPTWLFGIASVYYIELAMVSVHPQKRMVRPLRTISLMKAMMMIVLLGLIMVFADPGKKGNIGIAAVIINTIIGASLSAGILSLYYLRQGLSPAYRYYIIGVLIILPSSLVFLMDINLHQWFDKNDISHLLMGAGIVYFYLGTIRLFNGNSLIPRQI